LGERFNTTLTRGILSGYRTLDDKRYIQSDVAILPGNSGGPLLDSQGTVIGITVMGLGARGIAGMNFFIPIGEALAKLGVEVN
jgi:serine protease Do